MATNWEAIADDTYVSEDWGRTIERVGNEWRCSIQGEWRRSFPSLEMAKRWMDGEVIR